MPDKILTLLRVNTKSVKGNGKYNALISSILDYLLKVKYVTFFKRLMEQRS